MSLAAVRFVAPSAYPLGGVATWLDRLVPDLRARGVDAKVVLTEGRHHDATAYEAAHSAIAPALRVRAATGTREGRVVALARLLRECRDALVVSVNVPDALLAAGRLGRAGNGTRAVMSVHGLEPDLFHDLECLAPLLDGVVCSNRLAAAHAARASGMARERVRYAPCGTELPPAPVVRGDAPPLVIGFAGRFERFQKRVQDLAPIATALARRGVAAHWLVAGDGPDRAEVRALEAAVPGAVEVLGRIDAADMAADFHHRCHVLLNPSEWETGPIVVWEAMARGVAVVSARYVGSGLEAALVHEQNCLLYPAGDVHAAARCLARAASARLRRALCTRARALVAQRYSRQASAAAWAAALEAIASLPPRRGTPPPAAPAGRLDRWLGPSLGERVRSAARHEFAHADAGGEWPHCLRSVPRDDPAHWRGLRALDARPEAAAWS